MKLNKVFKKAMLASMTLLMAASLTFTGCSSSTGSDDDNNSNNNSGGNNDPITMALPTLELKTGYKWNDATNSEGSGESFYDGVFVKLTGQLDPSKLSAGLKCTFTLTGSVTKNFDYVNAEESTNPKLTLQIVDTSAAANYWTMLSKQEVDFVEDANGKVELKWEFNLDKNPVTKNASEITIFVKLMGDPAYNAANKLTITSEDPLTPPTTDPANPNAELESAFTLPEGAVALQLHQKTGDEAGANADFVTLGANCDKPFAFVSQTDLNAVKVGATIFFTVKCEDGQTFRVQNWSWADLATGLVNVTTEAPVTPTIEDDQMQYSATGTFCFNVTADTKTKLAEGIEFHGNGATISRVAYVNPPDIPSGEPNYTEVWSEGKTVESWGDICLIDHASFSADVKTVRVTYSNPGEGACFKPTVSSPWTAGVFASAAGGTIANDDGIGELNAAGGTVVLTFADGMLAKVIGEGVEGAWGGLSIQGQNITITKVEIGK